MSLQSLTRCRLIFSNRKNGDKIRRKLHEFQIDMSIIRIKWQGSEV